MNNVFDYDEIRNLTIGTVESVSPTEIKVFLETNAPQSVAINTGVPTHFPKINGYVLIPNEQGAIVGVITWIGTEHSTYPKRKGFKDFDLIDLPFPLRKMFLTPLGILKKNSNNDFEIERGVYSYPSVGDNVILPTNTQLIAIVENSDGKVEIGKAPVAGNASIKINPDKLFGRHLAVLGNTGSGKSCSVAGLIRWSLEEAQKKIKDGKTNLNSRFLILDPNGEYFDSFNDFGENKVRKFRIKLDDQETGFDQLKVPAWMWNSQEWINFSQAAPGAQRPLLLKTLVDLKNASNLKDSELIRVESFLTSRYNLLLSFVSNLPNKSDFIRFVNFTDSLEKIVSDLDFYASKNLDGFEIRIEEIKKTIELVLQRRTQLKSNGDPYYVNFTNQDIEEIIERFKSEITSLQSTNVVSSEVSADSPIQFPIDDLIPYLEMLAENMGNNILQFVQMLSLRMRFLLSDERLKGVVCPKEEITLTEWLNSYIGNNNSENGIITIIDLSLISSDIIHIVIAVLSRLTFEATQRYRRINKQELPTVIVLEEAHTFLRESTYNNTNTNLCLETFERIAREGRKFGLSMVLSSQRPSELSQTVLSQCNTFLLHRIVNDRDQELVKKMVPDSLSGLLRELPILPSRKAILVGWAFPIPVLVEMNYLEKSQRPSSNDPSFWDVWTGNKEREIDWDKIVKDWQGLKE